jgi:hypothetical protein
MRTTRNSELTPKALASASPAARVALIARAALLVAAWLAVTPPPVGAQVADELIVELRTGNDDLRGGNDNVNLILEVRNRPPLRFSNVNGGRRWADRTTNVVRRALPAGLRRGDLLAVRIEVLASGGVSGDNWNLDQLRVRARLGGSEQQLLDTSGRPLFRFTGDQRSRRFALTAEAPAFARAVMTSFDPRNHGFQFSNQFTNLVVGEPFDFTTGGLCGGMVYSVLDYLNGRLPVPRQSNIPANGSTLQRYIYDRQTASLLATGDKWAELGFNVGGSRNREFFNWGLQPGSGRLGELQERIDRGVPVPLGLQGCGGDCRCTPRSCPGNHQVLAIGYQLGRYQMDLGEFIDDVSIFVYDPNYPNRRMTLKPNNAGAWYGYVEEPDRRWRAYFVDTQYRASRPPTIAATSAPEVVLTIRTGDDDLRGGRDNLNVILLRRGGTPLRFDNVNRGQRWIDRSLQSVVVPLPAGVNPGDLIGVRLETTFRGGTGGDNWDLRYLKVETRVGDVTTHRLTTDAGSGRLFRFTGDRRTADVPW